MLTRLFPFILWWPMVNRTTIKADILAGLTGAVIVLPQGVAFAMIAGMPPEYGLYTAMIPPIIAALWGSSWQLVSGPTTAISIVVLASISAYAEPTTPEFIELVLVTTFLAGAFQFALGVARLGSLVNFVSHTVVIAFTAGAAMLIATSQMKHAFGLTIPRGLNFPETWWQIILNIKYTNVYVVIVSMGTLFSAVLMKRFFPKMPYMLFGMLFGSVLSLIIGGQDHGVLLVGELPRHLPPPSVPNITLDNIKLLASDAFAIALLGLISAVSISRVISAQTHQRVDGNQEFIGQGLSNLVGCFFSCYAASGSFTRSGVNHQAGARTPMAAIIASIFLALVLLLIAPLTAYLPIPAMGGIIMLVAYNLIDAKQIRTIFKASKSETGVMLVTFLSTLFLELEFAIYIGVILSLIFYLQRTSKPSLVKMAPDPSEKNRRMVNIERVKVDECPQLHIVRIDGSLFFGAINRIATYLHHLSLEDKKNVLILGKGINFIDVAGGEFLLQESHKWKALGGNLYISGLKKESRQFLQKAGYTDKIGVDHIFMSKEEAITHIYGEIDRGICEVCEKRIFVECGGLGGL